MGSAGCWTRADSALARESLVKLSNTGPSCLQYAATEFVNALKQRNVETRMAASVKPKRMVMLNRANRTIKEEAALNERVV